MRDILTKREIETIIDDKFKRLVKSLEDRVDRLEELVAMIPSVREEMVRRNVADVPMANS